MFLNASYWHPADCEFYTFSPAGPETLMACQWTSDEDIVVMEISHGKDAEPCTLNQLLREMEEAGIVDVTLNSHVAERPGVAQASDDGLSPHPAS